MKKNPDTESVSEIESLKECNSILKDHLQFLRKKLEEKEKMLEFCLQSMEKMQKAKEKTFEESFYKISLN